MEKTTKTTTYADRIRAMNDEELAKFLCDFRRYKDTGAYPCNKCVALKYCNNWHNGMFDWLQQPTKMSDIDFGYFDVFWSFAID